jgi:NifB/MoaA-like Fe-S oxidoreductase
MVLRTQRLLEEITRKEVERLREVEHYFDNELEEQHKLGVKTYFIDGEPIADLTAKQLRPLLQQYRAAGWKITPQRTYEITSYLFKATQK